MMTQGQQYLMPEITQLTLQPIFALRTIVVVVRLLIRCSKIQRNLA